MNCPNCGSPSAAAGGFCSACGMRQPAVPQGFAVPMPYQSRVERHLKTLGILWSIFAAYRLCADIFGLLFANALLSQGHFSRLRHYNPGIHLMHAALPISLTAAFVMALVSGITAYGLLKRKSWARMLAIVFGVCAMIKLPLGTALGIYTLWVLVPAASAVEYEAIAED